MASLTSSRSFPILIPKGYDIHVGVLFDFSEIPSSPLIRRSDDNLVLNCTTEDGRTGFASVPSSMGGKIVASAVFLDLGITDAITDKHREYPASFVVPVKK